MLFGPPIETGTLFVCPCGLAVTFTLPLPPPTDHEATARLKDPTFTQSLLLNYFRCCVYVFPLWVIRRSVIACAR